MCVKKITHKAVLLSVASSIYIQRQRRIKRSKDAVDMHCVIPLHRVPIILILEPNPCWSPHFGKKIFTALKGHTLLQESDYFLSETRNAKG